eukprot:GAHX01000675.1.p1 GENE.GAHX01000675.1~~GAHX01000675.1.p1  ORF type:complete len:1371 (+),score=248.50 GAHX01000675.1:43-4113(+)
MAFLALHTTHRAQTINIKEEDIQHKTYSDNNNIITFMEKLATKPPRIFLPDPDTTSSTDDNSDNSDGDGSDSGQSSSDDTSESSTSTTTTQRPPEKIKVDTPISPSFNYWNDLYFKVATNKLEYFITVIYCKDFNSQTLPHNYKTTLNCTTVTQETDSNTTKTVNENGTNKTYYYKKFRIQNMEMGYYSFFIFVSKEDGSGTDYFSLTGEKSELYNLTPPTQFIYREAEGITSTISITSSAPSEIGSSVNYPYSATLYCIVSDHTNVSKRQFWDVALGQTLQVTKTKSGNTFSFKYANVQSNRYYAYCASTYYPASVRNYMELSSEVETTYPNSIQVSARGAGISDVNIDSKSFDRLTFTVSLNSYNDKAVCYLSKNSLLNLLSDLTSNQNRVPSGVKGPIESDSSGKCIFNGLEDSTLYNMAAFSVTKSMASNNVKYYSEIYTFPHSVRTFIRGIAFKIKPKTGDVLPDSLVVDIESTANNYARCCINKVTSSYLMSILYFWGCEEFAASQVTISATNRNSIAYVKNQLLFTKLDEETDYYVYCATSGSNPVTTKQNASFSTQVVHADPFKVTTLRRGSDIDNLNVKMGSITNAGFSYTFLISNTSDYIRCMAVTESDATKHSLLRNKTNFWSVKYTNEGNKNINPVLSLELPYYVDNLSVLSSNDRKSLITGLDSNYSYILLCASNSGTKAEIESDWGLPYITANSGNISVGIPKPINLLRSGVNFLDKTIQISKVTTSVIKIKFKTVDSSFDVSNDVVRCIATSQQNTNTLQSYSKFWQPPEIMNEQSGFHIKVENNYGNGYVQNYKENNLSKIETENGFYIIEITELVPATYYEVLCSTSSTSSEKTYKKTSFSSPIINYNGKILTLGETKAIQSITPNKIIRNSTNVIQLISSTVGDGNLVKIALVEMSAKQEDCMESDYIFYLNPNERIAELSVDKIGRYKICYTTNNGQTWYLQDTIGLNLHVVAADPDSITKLVLFDNFIVGKKQTQIQILSKIPVSEFKKDFKKKIAYGHPTCQTPRGFSFLTAKEIIEQPTTHKYGDDNTVVLGNIYFDSYGTFPVCYSDDEGYNWTTQTALGLKFSVYSSNFGPAESRLKYLRISPTPKDLYPTFNSNQFGYILNLEEGTTSIALQLYTVSFKSKVKLIKYINFVGPKNKGEKVYTTLNSNGMDNQITITSQTKFFSLEVTAEDTKTSLVYDFNVNLIATFKHSSFEGISPSEYISGVSTHFTVQFKGYTPKGTEWVGFVPDTANDCSFPVATSKLNVNGQGEVILIGYENSSINKYKICFSNNNEKDFEIIEDVFAKIKNDESVVLLLSLIAVTSLSGVLLIIGSLIRAHNKAHRIVYEKRDYY